MAWRAGRAAGLYTTEAGYKGGQDILPALTDSVGWEVQARCIVLRTDNVDLYPDAAGLRA